MMNNYKNLLFIYLVLVVLGYTAFFIFDDFTSANAFLAGFIIIVIDLVFLARRLPAVIKTSSVGGFIMQSVIRWLFIGFCIYFAIVVLGLYKWSFAVGIILPFVGVFITLIYQILRRKEDGTSS